MGEVMMFGIALEYSSRNKNKEIYLKLERQHINWQS
jgi:hypothetical protein